MWGRNYTSCQKMVTVFRKKGYSTDEAWELVARILRDTRDGDDLKRRAESVLTKAEYEKVYGGAEK